MGQKQPALSAFLACDCSVVVVVAAVAAAAAFVAAGIVPKIVAAASCQLIELARQTRVYVGGETRRAESMDKTKHQLLYATLAGN